jgi:hypothetical protein
MCLHCNLQLHSPVRSGFSNESQCNECLSRNEIQQFFLSSSQFVTQLHPCYNGFASNEFNSVNNGTQII